MRECKRVIEKEKKKEKREEEWQERYERDESSERKIKCKEGCHVVERRNFHSFPTMCNPTTRTSSVPRNHNFLLPLHMSTILYLCKESDAR
jgi:hypothetical protein